MIGAARSRLGDQQGARAALEDANKALSAGRLATARSAAWLHAEVYLVLGNIELKDGHADAAASEFHSAVSICDRVPNLNATPFQGDLYLNLARAEAKLGQSDRAIADYKRGIDLFRNGKRDVSEARNLVSPYFDLLLDSRPGESGRPRRQGNLFRHDAGSGRPGHRESVRGIRSRDQQWRREVRAAGPRSARHQPPDRAEAIGHPSRAGRGHLYRRPEGRRRRRAQDAGRQCGDAAGAIARSQSEIRTGAGSDGFACRHAEGAAAGRGLHQDRPARRSRLRHRDHA